MAQPGPAAGTIRFGVYEVDLANAELRKHGLRIPIQEQPFQVLTALLERPGEIVARDHLVRRLWPDGTFVDFDRGLNAAVTRLRQALTDSAENPRYVETVAKRGYRFIAPVGISAEPETRGASKFRPLWASLALISMLAVAGAIWLTARRLLPPGDPSKPVPITTYPGFERTPSFSPDGNQVAFTWDEDKGEPHLYVKQIGGGDPLRIVPGPGAVYGPAWSRDGRQIAFVRGMDQATLAAFVVPALGGVERKVAEFASSYFDVPYARSTMARGLDWTPDGKQLVVTGADHPGGKQRLFLVDLETGERRWITSVPEKEIGDFSPAVSPDGRNLAFCRRTSIFATELNIIPLSNRPQADAEPRRLATGGGLVRSSPTWAFEGREIVYQSGEFGNVSLWRIGVEEGSVARRVAVSGTEAYDPAVSRSGRLAYAHHLSDCNIWRQELPSRGAAVPPPVNLIASTTDDRNARYSPDGARIAFQSLRSGSSEIWVCASDGSRCVQLTVMGGPHTGSPSWSPDGKRIAFDSAAVGQFNIWVVDANGGTPRRVTDRPGDVSPSWSSDGKAIYFASQRTGTYEVWKASADGGAAVQVTRTGGYSGFEAPDGRTLYYTKFGNVSKLWKSGVDGSGEIEFADGIVARGVVVRSDRVYYLHRESGGGTRIRCRMLQTGKDLPIALMQKRVDLGLSLSPDGKYVLYTQVDQDGTDLMLVDNFK